MCAAIVPLPFSNRFILRPISFRYMGLTDGRITEVRLSEEGTVEAIQEVIQTLERQICDIPLFEQHRSQLKTSTSPLAEERTIKRLCEEGADKIIPQVLKILQASNGTPPIHFLGNINSLIKSIDPLIPPLWNELPIVLCGYISRDNYTYSLRPEDYFATIPSDAFSLIDSHYFGVHTSVLSLMPRRLTFFNDHALEYRPDIISEWITYCYTGRLDIDQALTTHTPSGTKRERALESAQQLHQELRKIAVFTEDDPLCSLISERLESMVSIQREIDNAQTDNQTLIPPIEPDTPISMWPEENDSPFFDLTVVAHDQEIKANRTVLASRSLYFRQKLTGDEDAPRLDLNDGLPPANLEEWIKDIHEGRSIPMSFRDPIERPRQLKSEPLQSIPDFHPWWAQTLVQTESNINEPIDLISKYALLRIQKQNLIDDTFSHLAQSAPQLTALDISGCVLDQGSELRHLGSCCPLLTKLIGSNCANVNQREIIEGISTLALTSIDISWNDWVGDEIIVACAKPHLEAIKLQGCPDISPGAILTLAEQCSRLHTLDLAGCREVSDVEFEAIGLHCMQLRVLNVMDCDLLTPSRLACIGERCPGLEKINLDCLLITETAIINLTKECKALRRIYVSSRIHLSQSQFETLSRSRPKCKIIHPT